jgi:hypothetical protein
MPGITLSDVNAVSVGDTRVDVHIQGKRIPYIIRLLISMFISPMSIAGGITKTISVVPHLALYAAKKCFLYGTMVDPYGLIRWASHGPNTPALTPPILEIAGTGTTTIPENTDGTVRMEFINVSCAMHTNMTSTVLELLRKRNSSPVICKAVSHFDLQTIR